MSWLRSMWNAFVNRFGILRGLFGFLGRNKMWWLIPMILVLAVFFVIILLGQATPLGPFIYTLF